MHLVAAKKAKLLKKKPLETLLNNVKVETKPFRLQDVGMKETFGEYDGEEYSENNQSLSKDRQMNISPQLSVTDSLNLTMTEQKALEKLKMVKQSRAGLSLGQSFRTQGSDRQRNITPQMQAKQDSTFTESFIDEMAEL